MCLFASTCLLSFLSFFWNVWISPIFIRGARSLRRRWQRNTSYECNTVLIRYIKENFDMRNIEEWFRAVVLSDSIVLGWRVSNLMLLLALFTFWTPRSPATMLSHLLLYILPQSQEKHSEQPCPRYLHFPLYLLQTLVVYENTIDQLINSIRFQIQSINKEEEFSRQSSIKSIFFQ